MAAEAKFEVTQKTAELTMFVDTENNSFADLHNDKEELESNEIVVEDVEEATKPLHRHN